jgi:type II secretion system protein H
VQRSPGVRGRRSPRARAGFSLIEVLAVILVMGLIATLVTINWRAILPRTELHSAVRELHSTLQGARSDAIARNAPFTIEYDLEQHRYRMVTPFRADGRMAVEPAERVALSWRPLPHSVRFQSLTIDENVYEKGLVYVQYDALGSVAGHVIVLAQPEYENHYTLEVHGLLGLVEYHDGVYRRDKPTEEEFR